MKPDATCPRCGFNPAAVVLESFEFVIEREAPSMNARLVNSGPSRFRYGKERGVWVMEFRAARLNLRLRKASGLRRVGFRRVYGGRARERDHDNLVGGMKAVVDAMVLEGLLVNDTPALAEIHYAQERVRVGLRAGLHVTIEVLA